MFANVRERLEKSFKNKASNTRACPTQAHAIRDILVQLGEQRRRTPQEFKAWSQNLGHEQVLTTFTSYRVVTSHRHAALVRELATAPQPSARETLETRLARLERLIPQT